ncbi:MAG: MarR family transcriptional regulator [Clostridium sp.]|nr:MarR family transcriptional regulator [Clostridium sp.]
MQYKSIENAYKILQVYGALCKPLCQEIKMPQTAFDILMFLANNPEYSTARDIVEIRKIKANLVSINVDKLVQEGFLERQSIANDRRKTKLICTEKAQPIIDKGHKLQENFIEKLFENIDENSREIFKRTIENIEINLDNIMKGWK